MLNFLHIFVKQKPRVVNVPLIKIEKKTNGKIEQAKVIISLFCLLSNIHLSDSELTVLAYFIVYKLTDQTKHLILKSKILASEASFGNTMTKLRKVGLVMKNNKMDKLNPNLDIELQPLMGVIIKVDNK